MDNEEKQFIRGYACACAFVGSGTGLGMPTSAQEMIGEGGFTKECLIEAGVEAADLENIYPEEAADEQ